MKLARPLIVAVQTLLVVASVPVAVAATNGTRRAPAAGDGRNRCCAGPGGSNEGSTRGRRTVCSVLAPRRLRRWQEARATPSTRYFDNAAAPPPACGRCGARTFLADNGFRRRGFGHGLSRATPAFERRLVDDGGRDGFGGEGSAGRTVAAAPEAGARRRHAARCGVARGRCRTRRRTDPTTWTPSLRSRVRSSRSSCMSAYAADFHFQHTQVGLRCRPRIGARRCNRS